MAASPCQNSAGAFQDNRPFPWQEQLFNDLVAVNCIEAMRSAARGLTACMKVIRQSRRDDEPAGRALFAWSFSETRRVSTLPAIDKYVNPSFVAGRGINVSAEIGRSGEHPRAIPRPHPLPACTASGLALVAN
jgi:hypothetical protein